VRSTRSPSGVSENGVIASITKPFILPDKINLLYGQGLLRPEDCKYGELTFRTEITDFFIFCHEKPYGELFSKITLKIAREFLILSNTTT